MILLFVYILAGAGFQAAVGTEKQEKDANVKYKGPVVYTNLPPPVLYFPNFPEHPKLSNRGSSGDLEDKLVDYVPFPYKDLPLLVYQSKNQPPIHVVEKNPNEDSKPDASGKPQSDSRYRNGAAVYRVSENDQYDNEEAESVQHPQTELASASEKYINVGLPNTQNQQYISIGVTSIQPQTDSHNPGHVAESGGYYNSMQYVGNQNAEQMQHAQYVSQDAQEYVPQDSQQLRQTAPSFVYYSNQQYPSHNVASQNHEHITQAIQNYILQHNAAQQLAPSAQQTVVAYSGKEMDDITPPSPPTQHVGITIIRQPAVTDDPSHGEDTSLQGHYSNYDTPQVQHPYSQSNDERGYEGNPQYVSIGVYPGPTPGNDYEQDPQQYYNSIESAQNNNYQNTNEEYRQTNQEQLKPSASIIQNQNSQTPGYQLISIDLSTLRNKMANQEKNNYAEQNQQPYQNINTQIPVEGPYQNSLPPKPVVNYPPQDYKLQNQNANSFAGGEKAVQQIVIQIPQTILPEQINKATGTRGSSEMPYTGTAQIANIVSDSNRTPNRPSSNGGPIYNRPPPIMQHPERPRGPSETFGRQQNGLLSNGINIAIIKQTESSNNSPTYKATAEAFERRRPFVQSGKGPNRHNQMSSNRPSPPSFSRAPQLQRPRFGYKTRFPPNNLRFNKPYEIPAISSAPYPIAATRHHQQRFKQYRNKPVVHSLGGHPGIHASSNLHFTTANPPALRPSFFRNAYTALPSVSLLPTSATKNQPHLVPSSIETPMSFIPFTAESTLHAFTNNISNSFGDVNFDDINAYLSSNYNLFGSMASEQDKKKVKEETKFFEDVTSDLLSQDLAGAGMVSVLPPPYGLMKPPPSGLNSFPYHNLGQPIGNFGPPGVVDGRNRIRLSPHFQNLQRPYIRNNRLFTRFHPGKGLRKRPHRLKSKLAELRYNIRQKKIAPRQESVGEDSRKSKLEKIISEIMIDSNMFDKASPRSMIIQTEGPGLDGITIPLNPNLALSSRVSTDEDDGKKSNPMPPIIVYKGDKPPLEIYGSKSDIENIKQDNKTEGKDYDDTSDLKNTGEVNSSESSFDDILPSSDEQVGYLHYMYSMLPDLIRDSMSRRNDDATDGDKWFPVQPTKYAIAEDSYDRNETSFDKRIPPVELKPPKDSTASQSSSTNAESSIKENVEGLFSLMGKEETSDTFNE